MSRWRHIDQRTAITVGHLVGSSGEGQGAGVQYRLVVRENIIRMAVWFEHKGDITRLQELPTKRSGIVKDDLKGGFS